MASLQQNLAGGYNYPGSVAGGGFPGTRWFNVETQYNGYLYGGSPSQTLYFSNSSDIATVPSWFDLSQTPASPTRQTNEAEIQKAANYFANQGYAIDGNSLIVLALGPGSSASTNCALHDSLDPVDGYQMQTAYIMMPYQYSSGCDYGQSPIPGLAIEMSTYAADLEHEFFEAVTDPRWLYGGSPTWAALACSTETADYCAGGGIVPLWGAATQPSFMSTWTQPVIPHVSNKAGSGGACVYARSTEADAFVIGGSGDLFHQNMTADSSIANGSWYDWGNLGATQSLMGNPASVSWSPGRTDVFVLESSAPVHLLHAYVDKYYTWTCPGPNSPCYDDWGPIPSGYSVVGSPTVTSWGPERLDVFVTAYSWAVSNFILLHRMWDAGADSGWVDRGAPPPGLIWYGPAATTYSPGNVDVFAEGGDGNLYHGVYTQSPDAFAWSFWHSPPSSASISAEPDAASWLPGRFDVMVIDSGGSLWDCGADTVNKVITPWSSCARWTPPFVYYCDNLGSCYWTYATFRSKPSIIALGDQRLVVAAADNYYNVGWLGLWDWGQNTGGWVSTGGYLPAGIDLSSW